GLPILFRNDLVGMIGLANREEGYSDSDVSYLAPLLQTLGQLIQALRKDSEERIIRRRLEQQRQALRALNEITALPSLDTSVRLQQALALGCQYLAMDYGIVSHVEDNSYLVLAQHSTDEALLEEERFELGTTYCALTLQNEDVLPIEFMGESRFKGHPCYGRHGLESYIGVALVVNNQRYGTLNFSARQARKHPFGETDLEFVRLMGRWVSSSLSRWGMEQEQERILDRFKKLTEHLPGVVYQYQQDADGHAWFPYSSNGLWDVCGVTPEQASGDAALVVQATHPDDLQMLIDSIAASTRDLSLWQCEYRVLHPERGERWMAGQARPEQLADGVIIWHGFITDVTPRKQVELALERERERLASIIQATNIGTWEWNVQTGETLLNERWAEIVGYRLEELQPLTIEIWKDMAHPDDLKRSEKLLRRHFAGELNYYECKSRMRHKNGEWVWINSRGRLIRRDEQGKPLWMSGTHADITAEMLRDAEITRARAFLRAVIDASTEVSVITTDLDGVITLFNSGAEKLLGYKAEDMIGLRKPTHFHLPTEVERRAANLGRETGQAVSDMEVFFCNVREGQAETLPWTYVHCDGSQRLVNLTVSGIVDEQQQLNGFLLIGTDITDLIQATRALQKSESRFRSMVSNLPGAVYRCNSDADWSMSYMSEEIAVITGYPAADFIDNNQRSFASIIHPDDLHLTYQVIEQVERHQAYELNYRILHAQGHEVWVREKGRGDYDSHGKLLWLSGFIWDATEQHRVDQMKSQFVSTVSHELRTPLTSITGSLALINNGVLGTVPENMRKLLQIAHSNSMQLNNLINDLLDMDKLEAGKMRFNLLPQPLIPLLLKALESNASYASQFQVTLECGHIDNVRVTVDAQRLGQILNNYLSNAIKFSHPGDTVLLEAHYDQGKVRIRVTDKGLGIAADFQARIFSKFSQADSTDTRQRGGTGLGLAICRELAERMQAELGFESEAGQGSSFWCLLDAQPIEDREA
ncbi:MAG: PAS domain-containing protein, partial [Pseudomonas sp.]